MMADPEHVFISYVREDNDLVERLVRELKTNDVRPWLDRNDIPPGARWKRVIKRAIEGGSFFLACFSTNYSERSITYMNEELLLAVEMLRQMPIDRPWFIPLLLEDCRVPDLDIGPTETLNDLQHVPLYEDWDLGVQSLLNVIRPADSLEHATAADSSKPRGEEYLSVLFVASDPVDMRRLRLGEELREVQGAILGSKMGAAVRLEVRMAAKVNDVAGTILETQPDIVHFSGHGLRGELILENEEGLGVALSSEALVGLFESVSDRVKCVILNFVYSATVAQALARKIDYVIAVKGGFSDGAAMAFSAGFYQALGFGRSIEEAFQLGSMQVELEGFPGDSQILFSPTTGHFQ